jgi:AraC-like DNA-binding protein
MPTVVALIVDRRQRERLTPILRAFGDVLFCDRPVEIWRAVEHGDVVAVVINPIDTDGRPIAPTVEALRRLLPALPIIVHSSADDPEQRQELAALGLTRGLVVVDDQSDTNRFLVTAQPVAGSRVHNATSALLDAVATIRPPLDPLVNTYTRTVIRQSRWPLGVTAVMKAIDETKRRTIEKQLRDANLPSAESLIGWTFALHAVWDLELPGASLSAIAQRLGFPTVSSLRSVFRNRVRLSPREVMRSGGFPYLLERFVALLHGDWSREPQSARMAERHNRTGRSS